MASRVRRMPPIKVDDYRWQSPSNDPTLRVRRACATEAMFGIQASSQHGENDFFIAATVRFHASFSGSKKFTLHDLERKTQSSLVQLRFSQPQVAVTLSWDKRGNCSLQYRAPKDMDEVHRWAAGIVTAEANLCSPLELRDQVEEKKKQQNSVSDSNAVMLYISAPISALDTALENSEVHYLFRFSHCLFDGIAARQIVTMLFQNLVAELSDSSVSRNEDIDWKQSTSNVTPAFVELMDPQQDLSGPRFDRTVHDHMVLMKKKSTLGLKPLQSKPRRPQTEFYTFTEAESQSLLSSIRTRLQPGHNITHLAMGALVLALMKRNGAQNATTFSCISVIDGRRYLKEGYRQGEKPYIASCQTPAIIAFENVTELAISDASSKSEIRDKLEKATGLARNSFVGNLATPCKLAMSVPVMELGAVLAAMSQKSAAPPQIESPVFASDGITERYIPRQLCSNSNEQVFQVDDVYFFSNQSLSTVSVRLSSWRDSVRLSIDYNEGCHDKGDMVAYLNEIANIMLVLTD